MVPARHSLQIHQLVLQQRYPNGLNGTDEEVYKMLEKAVDEVNNHIRYEKISAEELKDLRIARDVFEDEAIYYRKKVKD